MADMTSDRRHPRLKGRHMNLDRIAQDAVDRHRRLLCHKVLELALGELVALDGVSEARKAILIYARSLRYY